MAHALVFKLAGGCSVQDIDYSGDGVTISQPVGAILGSGNVPVDVRTVQNALNTIPLSKGGCKGGTLLAVDGNCGSKTEAAILKYQTKNFGSGDSRVDPGGRTARQMSLDMDPQGAPDEQLVRLILTLVPAARACIQAARMKLDMAQPAFQGVNSGIMEGTNQAARALVNKHFSLDQFPDWRPEFWRIQDVFSTMFLAAGRQNGSLAEWQGIFIPNTASSMESGSDAAAAYTYAGGYRKLGAEQNVLPFAQRIDRIYLCRPLAKKSPQFQTIAIVHELAHYCGGDQDTVNMIRDMAYGWVDAPKMQSLLPWWRTRNAQSFANFAYDAAFGVRPCDLH